MEQTAWRRLTDTVKTVAYALLIAGLFRTLFFQPFYIPSGSMKDTLLVGDYVFISKMAYGYSRFSCPFDLCPIGGRLFGRMPDRGDVVVFSHPVSGEVLVKRLIGLPGDTVQVTGGALYLNGSPVAEEPAGTFAETKAEQGPMADIPRCANDPVGQGSTCLKARLRETLPGGVTHDILRITEGGMTNDTPTFRVPPGSFFFMGDNRDNSLDSRFPQEMGGVGFVPYANLIGRADLVLFSSAGSSLFAFWTWRPARFFLRLH